MKKNYQFSAAHAIGDTIYVLSDSRIKRETIESISFIHYKDREPYVGYCVTDGHIRSEQEAFSSQDELIDHIRIHDDEENK